MGCSPKKRHLYRKSFDHLLCEPFISKSQGYLAKASKWMLCLLALLNPGMELQKEQRHNLVLFQESRFTCGCSGRAGMCLLPANVNLVLTDLTSVKSPSVLCPVNTERQFLQHLEGRFFRASLVLRKADLQCPLLQAMDKWIYIHIYIERPKPPLGFFWEQGILDSPHIYIYILYIYIYLYRAAKTPSFLFLGARNIGQPSYIYIYILI